MKKTICIIAVVLLCASFSLHAMELEKKKPKACCGLVDWVMSHFMWKPPNSDRGESLQKAVDRLCEVYSIELDKKLIEATYEIDIPVMRELIKNGANVNTTRFHEWSVQKENGRRITLTNVKRDSSKFWPSVYTPLSLLFGEFDEHNSPVIHVQFKEESIILDIRVAYQLRDRAVFLLLANGGRENLEQPCLCNAIDNNKVDLVKQLIGHKAVDLHKRVQELFSFFPCSTYLHYAVKTNKADPGIVALLLKKGISPSSMRTDDNTPLHDLAFCAPGVVELLVDFGADVNARNEFKRTPLYYALKFPYWSSDGLKKLDPKVTKLRSLLLHGALLPVQDTVERTPFHYLFEHGPQALCPYGIRELFVAVRSPVGKQGEQWKAMKKRLFTLLCCLKFVQEGKLYKDIRHLLKTYFLAVETEGSWFENYSVGQMSWILSHQLWGNSYGLVKKSNVVDTLVARHIETLHKALLLVDNNGKMAKECFHDGGYARFYAEWASKHKETPITRKWFDPDQKKIKEQFGPEIRERYERVLKGLPQVELTN